jgi:fatty acid desaturase
MSGIHDRFGIEDVPFDIGQPLKTRAQQKAQLRRLRRFASRQGRRPEAPRTRIDLVVVAILWAVGLLWMAFANANPELVSGW